MALLNLLEKKYFFILYFSLIFSILFYKHYYPILLSTKLIFPFSITPFNFIKEFPEIWFYGKYLFVVLYFFLIINFLNSLYSILFKIPKHKQNIPQSIKNLQEKQDFKLLNIDNSASIFLGYIKDTGNDFFITEKALYQNMLITGAIGTGKTSSAMYQITKQFIKYNSVNKSNKNPIIILDVKGNYHKEVINFCNKYKITDDLIILKTKGDFTYNPLDKPNISALVLANKLKNILELFSENNSESYWLDKTAQILAEAIKLCRLYNNGYVTFEELHNLITNVSYYNEKISILKSFFIKNSFSETDLFNLNSSIDFFTNEFFKLDERTSSILKSEISRITSCFISDLDVLTTFNPKQNSNNSISLDYILENKKILVLNINIAKYQNLSKILAAYIKLDYQEEVLARLSDNIQSKSIFICDEFHEFCTKSDISFFSQSREALSINIIATQSYTSLFPPLKEEYLVKALIQNLVNKLWFRNDDMFTIEEIQKQLGKEDKLKVSKGISENSKITNYSYISNTLKSRDSNISESLNSYTQNDYIYDTNFFSQSIDTFSCLAFISDGFKIIKPFTIKLLPHFLDDLQI